MYFASPVAYAVTIAFLFIMGLIFWNTLGSALLSGGAPQPTGVLGLFVTLMLFFSPALTMRLFAEEQRAGTLELLLTAPIREWELVVGKWLAAFGFIALVLALTVIYALILNQYTNPGLDWGVLLAVYLGLLLLSGAMLAMGVFVSSLFSNQIAVFFATMFLLIGVAWLIGLPFQNSTGTLATVVNYLVISDHFYNNFYTGTVDLTDTVYFVSVIVVFLFLAARVVESRRWR
jgi:ABC-2 type transport system permease protein